MEIIRIYTEDHRLIVKTQDNEYLTHCTLREMEEALLTEWFVRISRYEIINLNWVVGFDFSAKGTIKVSFEDGSYTWVFRRFVRAVEQRLEVPAQEGESRDE